MLIKVVVVVVVVRASISGGNFSPLMYMYVNPWRHSDVTPPLSCTLLTKLIEWYY